MSSEYVESKQSQITSNFNEDLKHLDLEYGPMGSNLGKPKKKYEKVKNTKVDEPIRKDISLQEVLNNYRNKKNKQGHFSSSRAS